jgi:hypothetical protein
MFKFFSRKKEEVKVVPQIKPQISINDIKDDDMMAAVLVATIDYSEQTKTDVRLVSIKQIG